MVPLSINVQMSLHVCTTPLSLVGCRSFRRSLETPSTTNNIWRVKCHPPYLVVFRLLEKVPHSSNQSLKQTSDKTNKFTQSFTSLLSQAGEVCWAQLSFDLAFQDDLELWLVTVPSTSPVSKLSGGHRVNSDQTSFLRSTTEVQDSFKTNSPHLSFETWKIFF